MKQCNPKKGKLIIDWFNEDWSVFQSVMRKHRMRGAQSSGAGGLEVGNSVMSERHLNHHLKISSYEQIM